VRDLYDPADELAVRSLAAAYTDAVNRRDADGMAAVFAPDGVIEKPGFGDPVVGIEKIRKRYQRLQRERDFLFQTTHSGIVEFTADDRAVARWWFGELKQAKGASDWLYIMGVYQDEAVKLEAGWRFARRVQTTVLNHELPAQGLEAFPLPDFFGIAPSALRSGMGAKGSALS
jgi:uncharacterized protein (TIGR02246 family)